MSNGKRRCVLLFFLALCLLLIVAIGWQMWNSLQQTRAIDYGARILTASPAEVCPGDKFTYPIHITIATVPAVSRITEGWCRADGICPLTLQNSPYYVNFARSSAGGWGWTRGRSRASGSAASSREARPVQPGRGGP